MTPSEWFNRKFQFSRHFETQNRDYLRKEDSIRLSVITQFFPPDFAATGQLIDELSRCLGQQGVDINIFTGQPGYAYRITTAPPVEQHGRVRVQRSHTANLFAGRIRGKAINGVLFTLRAALHLLRGRDRGNVLMLTTAPPFLPILGYLAQLLFKIPYICIIYDLYPDIAVSLGVISKEHWLAQIWNRINRLVWRKAKAIIVLSPTMKSRVSVLYPQITDKIFVIHSWADAECIVPIVKDKNWFAWKYNLVNRFTVTYSGNLGRCHDMETILATAIQLRYEPIQFVFIGEGAKREELLHEVNRLGLTNVLFLPYQDKEVLPYSLTACDLSLVSISPGVENLVAPSKLYPALAAGRPIAAICSKSSYLRQLILEADCGGVFDNGDSNGLAQFIRLLASDRHLACRLGESAREYLKSHFTLDKISQQYLEVLTQAVYQEKCNSQISLYGGFNIVNDKVSR